MSRIQKEIGNTASFKLSGKTAIVTGGAAGIGFGCSRQLAEAGASVLMAGRDSEIGDKKAAELTSAGCRAKFAKCDVTRESDVERVVEQALKDYGSLDIIVNNAGIYPHQPVIQMDMDTWDRVLDVNLRGVFCCCLTACREMIRQGRGGTIVNIASVSAFHPTAGLTAYDASKAGVLMLTRTLALELAQYGIRVNSVSPGITQTSWVSSPKALEYNTGRLSRVPMGRFGSPTEIGNVVLFLASDAASYVTGSDIVVDGGWTLT